MDKRQARKEYKELDEWLTAFRKRWNEKAFSDLEYTKIYHTTKGKQDDFPEQWYENVACWRQLKRILGIP